MKSKREMLKEAIVLLEHKQARELLALKEQLHGVYESVRPINLIKNTLHEVITSRDIGKDIMSGAIGLATGYINRKVGLDNNSSGLSFKRILSTVAQFALANFASKFTDKTSKV